MYFKVIIEIELHKYNAIVLKSFDFELRAETPSLATRKVANQQALIVVRYNIYYYINIDTKSQTVANTNSNSMVSFYKYKIIKLCLLNCITS